MAKFEKSSALVDNTMPMQDNHEMQQEKIIKQYRRASISAVIGGFLIHLTLGANYGFGNFSPYVVSYLRNIGHMTTYHHQDMGFVIGATYAGHACGMVVAGFMETILGPRYAVILGGLIMGVSTVISSYFMVSYIAFIMLYGLIYGLGKGVCYAVPISCAIRWLPHRKGVVSGVITAALGASGSILSQLQTHFINPDNIQPVPLYPDQVDSPRYFTDINLLHRASSFVFALGIGYFILVTIGAFLISEPNPQLVESVIALRQRKESKTGQSQSTKPISSTAIEYNFTGTEALKTSRFYFIFFLFFLCGLCLTFSNATWKFSPGAAFLDDRTLGLIGTFASLHNAIGKVLWGYVSDMTSARLSLIISNIIWGISLFAFSLFGTANVFVFGLFCCLNFLCGGGMFSLFPTFTAVAFGRKFMSTCYGLEFISQVFSSNVASRINQYMKQFSYQGLGIFYGSSILIGTVLVVIFGKNLDSPCSAIVEKAQIIDEKKRLLDEDV